MQLLYTKRKCRNHGFLLAFFGDFLSPLKESHPSETKEKISPDGGIRGLSHWEKWAAGGTFPSKSPAGANKDKEHLRPLKAIATNIACHCHSQCPH